MFLLKTTLDEVILNDVEKSTDVAETIMVTTTTNVVTDLVENIGGIM